LTAVTPWKHTPERPNYLADPEKEIDPTSFGGYVSALNGQHVPLTYLIKPNLVRKIVKRLTGWWPQTYDLSYLRQFDTLLVVHQISNAHEIASFSRRLKRTYPNIFVLGVPTQPYGILKEHIDHDPRARQRFIEYMNTCDLFLVVVKATQHWYESLTDTPIIYLPQIYPAQYANQFFLPRAKKDKVIFVAGITHRHDISKGQTVAKYLQQALPDYLIQVTEIPGVTLDLTKLQGSRYTVVPFEQWRQHLSSLGQYMLVINTDYTLTRGRVQADCAAVGTPSLGANSDGQADLFPELAAAPDTPIEDLVATGKKLLTDKAYYQGVVTQARAKLQKYDYEESAARFQMLVKQYR
jgi:hypothetical protein